MPSKFCLIRFKSRIDLYINQGLVILTEFKGAGGGVPWEKIMENEFEYLTIATRIIATCIIVAIATPVDIISKIPFFLIHVRIITN